jgi:hypothetical protein
MACRSGCPTPGAHRTWGECASGVGTMFVQSAKGLDMSGEKRLRAESDAYRAARRQGIQPDGTRMAQIQKAVELSDKHGKPYGATQ